MAKNCHNSIQNFARLFKGELKMRIAQVIFVGSAAALLMGTPVLANGAQTQKTDDQSTSSSCRAYRQAPDGSWQQLPCQEAGGGQTQHGPPPKPGFKSSENKPR